MQGASPNRTCGDRTIDAAVRAELAWTPELNSAEVEVQVQDSAVTLSGVVDAFSDLLAIGRAIRRVRGVTSAINNVTVNPAAPPRVSDPDIRRVVERALTLSSTVPRTVKSRVLNRQVTLTGEVDWDFQRETAQQVIHDLRGVGSVENQITLVARTPAEDSEQRLRNAMFRNPRIDASDVTVTIVDSTATLTGHVSSLAEKKQAGLATWACPNVTKVDNRLAIRS